MASALETEFTNLLREMSKFIAERRGVDKGSTFAFPSVVSASPLADKTLGELERDENIKEQKLLDILKYLREVTVSPSTPRYQEIMKIKEVIDPPTKPMPNDDDDNWEAAHDYGDSEYDDSDEE